MGTSTSTTFSTGTSTSTTLSTGTSTCTTFSTLNRYLDLYYLLNLNRYLDLNHLLDRHLYHVLDAPRTQQGHFYFNDPLDGHFYHVLTAGGQNCKKRSIGLAGGPKLFWMSLLEILFLLMRYSVNNISQ